MGVLYARVAGTWQPVTTGPKGDTGADGPQGPAGPTGPAITPGAWIALPFNTGWGPLTGWATPSYRKVGDEVQLRGTVATTGSGVPSNTIFTLPVGFRPPGNNMYFTVCSWSPTYARFDMGTTGAGSYAPIPPAGANQWLALSDFRFSVTA